MAASLTSTLPAQLSLGGRQARRRLPGFRFEFQPPPPADVLPRMDVAAFVGFAASGPLDTPVPVEDPRRFAEIFCAGGDLSGFGKPGGSGVLALAWDAERGEWAYGQLGPAVRAFLRNGGRRCWVVRVADAEEAETSRFLLPGVLQADVAGDGSVVLQPAAAWARSPGSWADGLRVGAGLTSQGVATSAVSVDSGTGEVTLRSATPIAAGDVLRLLYVAAGVVGYVAVKQAALVPIESSPPGAAVYQVRGPAAWFRAVVPEDLAVTVPDVATASWWGSATVPVTREALDLGLADARTSGDGTLSFRLPEDGGYPGTGSLVRIAAGAPEIWLLIDGMEEDAAGAAGEVIVSGRGLVRLVAAPSLATLDRCERLQLELTATLGDLDPWRLGDLDFAPDSDRYWGGLPADAELYDPEPENGGLAAEIRERRAALWRASSAPRFPLAGAPAGGASAGFSFPFVPLTGGFPVFGSQGAGAALAQHSAQPAVVRDGLSKLSSELFLDPDLAGNLTADLLNHANDLRYISPNARPLRGIHAVLAIDEVTLVAVPDATQRPWALGETPDLETPPASPIPERPAWREHGCLPATADEAGKVKPLAAPAWGEFLACTIRLVEPPVWTNASPAADSIIRLAWGPAPVSTPHAAAVYTVEEATLPDFADARRIYEGTDETLTLYGRSAGTYYYRVRGQESAGYPAGGAPTGNFSNWSEGLAVRIGPPAGIVLKPAKRANPRQLAPAEVEQRGMLLQVQRALLRMCAARGDLFAVLALPEQYREGDAIDYVKTLGPSSQPVFNPNARLLDLPLGFGEMGVLSYAAVYHPWLIEPASAEQDPAAQGAGQSGLRRTPPDGAMTGLIAARSLSRGAWVAPANQKLAAVVALTPPIARARWLDLLDLQVNVIRQEPEGFTALSADTLSRDPDLLQINVRRLMQLLRRMAEQLGPGFVFEPQGDEFRRRVRRDVEAVLRVLFDRGAFSGASPETSYQVTVRTTPQDLDAGRFIVEIRVAPSRPMEFLTVRVVQTGDRAVVTEE